MEVTAVSEPVPSWGVKLQTEVLALQETVATHIKNTRERHHDLYQRTERPSWAVTWTLTVMGGLIGSLLVWAVTHAV